jgi:hypothetical protein
MGTFILRFRGQGRKPAADVARIRSLAQLTVLDDSSPRMLLVEAPEEPLATLMAALPDWMMTRERRIPLPDPRPRPGRDVEESS